MTDLALLNTLELYLLKQIRLTLKDGSILFGKLQRVSRPESALTVDGLTYAFDSIQNLEHVGEITDYHNFKGYGEIDRILFTPDGLAEDFDRSILENNEFRCKVACRLHLNQGEVRAYDVRLLEKRHILHGNSLSKHPCIYRFEDGTFRIGRLHTEGDVRVLVSADGTKTVIDPATVTDISKAPEINEEVIVTLTDGTQVAGTVASNDEEAFVVFGDSGIPALVEINNVASLRFCGRVSAIPITMPNGQTVRIFRIHVKSGDEKIVFHGKQRNCRENSGLPATGDTVSFVAGVNGDGMIAKDIAVMHSSNGEAPSEEDGQLKTGVGVILMMTKDRKSGYIGKSFLSKGYANLMNEKPLPGRISFTIDQITFPCTPDNICVVEYTYRGNAETGTRPAESVKLLKTFELATCAKVEISPDGQIHHTPTYLAYLPLFLEKEVEITREDGSILSGWLKQCEGDTVVLTEGTAETETVLDKRTVKNVRVYGIVTSYRTDMGIGYVDNYWFHINNLRDNGEVINIVPGRRVLFSLVNTGKGKCHMADDMTLIREVPQHGYITGYDGVTCSIASAEDYEQGRESKTYPVASQRSDIAGKLSILDLERFDYPVSFLLRKDKFDDTRAVITFVNPTDARPKSRIGYVFRYIDKEPMGFGFITLPEEFETQLRNPNRKVGGLYFKQTDLTKSDLLPLNTSIHYYTVSYTLDPRGAVRSVTVLKKHDPRKMNIPYLPEEKISVETVRKPIAELLETPPQTVETSGYRYGLISFFSTNSASINAQYINKNLSDKTYDERIFFQPSRASYIGDKEMKTSKYTYLVRYVLSDTETLTMDGESVKTIDYSCPIEVLYAFRKKDCIHLSIEGEELVMELRTRALIPTEERTPAAEPSVEAEIPALSFGESILLQKADQSVIFTSYCGETEDTLVLEGDRSILKDEITRIYRFGVVTRLDVNTGIATINGITDFSLSVAEPKMLNILKNQVNFTRLHVLYAYENDSVPEVCRIPDDFSAQIPWQPGSVTAWEPDKRLVTVDHAVSYFVSVLSGNISRLARQNLLTGQEVYVRKVVHPFSLDGGARTLTEFAVEVHCRKETATVQHDEGKDLYLAAMDATRTTALKEESRQKLEFLEGKTVPVLFEPDADGRNLLAYLDDTSDLLPQLPHTEGSETDPEPEEDRETDPGTYDRLNRASLVQFFLSQTDLRQQIQGIALNEEGLPETAEGALKALNNLMGYRSAENLFGAAKIINRYPELNKTLQGGGSAGERLDRILSDALKKRCTEISADANSVLGELTYYLVTLLNNVNWNKRPKFKRSADELSRLYCLNQLFLQDFGTRREIQQDNRAVGEGVLRSVLLRRCNNPEGLISHLMLLDKTSAEMVCAALEKNPDVQEQILTFGERVDSTLRGADATKVIHTLRERYVYDLRRFRSAVEELYRNDLICDNLRNLKEGMQARFLKLSGADDAQRFDRLFKCCALVADSGNSRILQQQEADLRNAYREICDLEQDILSHPTRVAVELLLINGIFTPEDSVFAKIRDEITARLNQLYQNEETAPRLTCQTDTEQVSADNPIAWLIVSNEAAGKDLHPADDVVLTVESYKEGVELKKTRIPLNKSHLSSGERTAVEVELTLDPSVPVETSFSLGWALEYTRTVGFRDGMLQKKTVVFDPDTTLDFLITDSTGKAMDVKPENPYEKDGSGVILGGNQHRIFVGRKQEKDEIWKTIVRAKDGEESLIPGSAVIIHGQKKCGKTSLVNQILKEIEGNSVLNKKTIVLKFPQILENNGGAAQMDTFWQSFCINILTRLEQKVSEDPDLDQLLYENGVEIPTIAQIRTMSRDLIPSVADDIFRRMARCAGDKFTVFLVMDEFTVLCTTILEELKYHPDRRYLATIPNFIKTFSQYGFVQLIIGHEAMMRALETLGVLNHTAEFAKTVEISALSVEDSEELVRSPMKGAFGQDVYGTVLGGDAVARILDLSGRSPQYLHRICYEMFEYYTDPVKCPRTKLLPTDVEAVAQTFLQELILKDFDILLVEDGDEIAAFEDRATYKYLKTVAELANQGDGRTAAIDQVRKALDRKNREYTKQTPSDPDYFDLNEFDSVQDLLRARRVISITRDVSRIHINIGLFIKFINHNYGGN